MYEFILILAQRSNPGIYISQLGSCVSQLAVRLLPTPEIPGLNRHQQNCIQNMCLRLPVDTNEIQKKGPGMVNLKNKFPCSRSSNMKVFLNRFSFTQYTFYSR